MTTCRLPFEKSFVSKMRTFWLTFNKSKRFKYKYMSFFKFKSFLFPSYSECNICLKISVFVSIIGIQIKQRNSIIKIKIFLNFNWWKKIKLLESTNSNLFLWWWVLWINVSRKKNNKNPVLTYANNMQTTPFKSIMRK